MKTFQPKDYPPEYFLKTWRQSLPDEARSEDGHRHDPADDIHSHFAASSLRDWCDVADEARRIYNLMFADIEEENVEDGSPIDGVWTGAAAQAAHGVWSAVADALGLDKNILEATLEDWYFPCGEVPPPITMDEFIKQYKEHEQRWKEIGLT